MVDHLVIWGPCVLVAAAGLALATMFIKPAPPTSVTIAGGAEGGAYAIYAAQYADYLARKGIRADVLTTRGSIENAALLRDPDSGVDAALIQGGVLDADAMDRLEAVVAVFYEPLWLFVRRDEVVQRLGELRGRRVAIGHEGSGTHALARNLLAQSGVEDVTLLAVATSDAVAALRRGDADAVFVVLAPTAPLLADLLADPALHPVQLQHVHAFARRSDSLAAVTLYAGSVDPARHLPTEDLTLPAAAAAIAVNADTHPAVVQLLVQAAVEIHSGGGMLHEAGTFPNVTMLDLPLHADVRHFLDKGPSWLQRTFPFWLASLIDRAIILAVPLIALLLPLFRMAPPTYRWRIRSRIYRWYATLREIDERLRHEASRPTLEADARRLTELEAELLDVHVPLSYMEEFYHLRLHVEYVSRRLHRQLDRPSE
jgi:TRAP transporter TAXI family solute receptor